MSLLFHFGYKQKQYLGNTFVLNLENNDGHTKKYLSKNWSNKVFGLIKEGSLESAFAVVIKVGLTL